MIFHSYVSLLVSHEYHCMTKCLKCWLASRLKIWMHIQQIRGKHQSHGQNLRFGSSHKTCWRVNPFTSADWVCPADATARVMAPNQTILRMFPHRRMWEHGQFVRAHSAFELRPQLYCQIHPPIPLCSTWPSPRTYPIFAEHWWHGMRLSKAPTGRPSWKITLNCPISGVLPVLLSRTKDTDRNWVNAHCATC